MLNQIANVAEEGRKTWQIECELDGLQMIKLREKGQNWDREEVQEIPIPKRDQPQERSQNVQPNHFHNPYNFIPALPRPTQDPELGDHKPIGHGRYEKDYWSGRIAVKLTTVTPLLIPDAAEMTENDGHNTYPVRLGKDGKPYLPLTSIKGMLRSVYEAVTNSRLGIFEKHDDLLAYRKPANSGLQMVPAQIENDCVCLYSGTSEISEDGKPRQGNPMYAAWLHRWERNRTRRDRDCITYAGTRQLPEHREEVKFWAEPFAKYNSKGKEIFSYWKVRKVVPHDEELSKDPPNPSQPYGTHEPTGDPMRRFKGYVCVTNKNITNKHDERIFFSDSNQESIPLTDEIRERWAKLIESYQNNDDFKNGLPCPSALENAVWSRQVTGGDREKELTEGTLCYAHVHKNGSNFEIIDLYPVMISRSLYEQTPVEILNATLKPATNKEKLSPADRVFGWVNQNGKGSHKGQLRVHSISCESEDAIDDFGDEENSFPLAILGQPKPEQARFYCAEDAEGKPLHNGESNPRYKDKGDGYKTEAQNLRGRKVYPHHKGLPHGYWKNPLEDRTQQPDNTDHYQEYRRPDHNGQERNEQNRSIKSWVKPKTEFHFEIDLINLSAVELGALLWLLSSSDLHYHRLGGQNHWGLAVFGLMLIGNRQICV